MAGMCVLIDAVLRGLFCRFSVCRLVRPTNGWTSVISLLYRCSVRIAVACSRPAKLRMFLLFAPRLVREARSAAVRVPCGRLSASLSTLQIGVGEQNGGRFGRPNFLAPRGAFEETVFQYPSSCATISYRIRAILPTTTSVFVRKRYKYSPDATCAPWSSRLSQATVCDPAGKDSAFKSTRTRCPDRL